MSSPPTLTPALLTAGRRAFTRHGYHGATVERIAQEAGVSRVTLHRWGVTKDLLLAALVEEAVHDYQRRMWPALTGTGSVPDRLEQALSALCEAAEEHMGLLIALRAKTDEVFHEQGEEALTRTVFTEPLERLLHEGRVDGSVRVSDPGRGATVLFNLVGWTYIHLRSGHGWSIDSAEAAVLDTALHGVLDRTPRV